MRMDVLPQKEAAARSYGPNWFVGRESGGEMWSQEENKRFEDALAKYDGDAPDRWEKVAALIPGKTVRDVIDHYRELVIDVTEIESGRIPCPAYCAPSSFTFDWEEHNYASQGWTNSYCTGGGKRSGSRGSDHERKKGVPWTEEEHK